MTKILEKSFWRTTRVALKPRGRLVRVENRAGTGTPDVYWRLPTTGAWIELKVAIPTAEGGRDFGITREQLLWLADEVAAGGPAFVLLRVKRVTYLVRGDRAALLEGTLTHAELTELADVTCVGRLLGMKIHDAVERFDRHLRRGRVRCRRATAH